MSLPASRFLRIAFIAGCTILAGLLLAPRMAAARVSVSGSPVPDVALQIRGHTITAEVADTEPLRASGLMHRRALAPDRGMLFVFPDDEQRCFWMKNTLIPLSIAFIDEQGIIVALDDMQPLSEAPHCSGAQARYALEVNRGWFHRHSIRVGDNIRAVLPDSLPIARDGVPATQQ